MKITVQKFGGTSVGTPGRIRDVAQKIVQRRQEGESLAVVVSAMAGETDRLIRLSNDVSDSAYLREYDVLLASGEQVSAALLSMALQDLGVPARSFLAYQLPIITSDSHSLAMIQRIEVQALYDCLSEGNVAVIAGFQGTTVNGDITTLGRGGSDTTAVALAASLNAACCEIFTDVDGVYTCDPNVYSRARMLERISYDEMMELAVLGARVLHSRCVEMAKKYNVNIRVRSSFNDGKGTRVCEESEKMEGALISGITYSKGEARISVLGVPDRPGIAFQIFDSLALEGINVDMIIQNVGRSNMTDLTFTVPSSELDRAVTRIKQVAHDIKAEGVLADGDIAKISIVGAGMKSHPGVASRMFGALAREGINIIMISTSEIKISCIIDVRYTELAVRVLHDEFELEKEPGS